MGFFKLFSFVVFAFVLSCTGEVENNEVIIDSADGPEPVPSVVESPLVGVKYRMVNQEEGEDDAELPMGYWQSIKTYPEIYDVIDTPVKEKINRAIVELASKYSCDEYGDYSFTGNVKYLSDDVLSVMYEVMWMCGSMPSPDSTVGSVTFNLDSGQVVILDEEFLDAVAKDKFNLNIGEKIKLMNSAGSFCLEHDQFDVYYRTESAFVFVMNVGRHSDSACISEIKFPIDDMKMYVKEGSGLLK